MSITYLKQHLLLENISTLDTDTPYIVVDVDGVVMDNTHRLHHIVEVVDGKQRNKNRPDWHKYSLAVEDDTPLPFAHKLRRLMLIFNVAFVTGREYSDYQFSTFARQMRPFLPNDNWYIQFHGKEHTGMKTVEYKRLVLQEMRAYGLDIAFAIDDSVTNVNMFKEEGLCALRCHDLIDHTSMHY